MCNQLLEEITPNVTKNPNWEEYFLKNYFDDVPGKGFHYLHFTEVCETDVNGDDWYSAGITDKELIEVLLHRLKTDKISFSETVKDSIDPDNFKKLFGSFLETLLLMVK